MLPEAYREHRTVAGRRWMSGRRAARGRRGDIMVSALQKWTLSVGQGVARYSVAKFTPGEAAAIHPLLVHSPFLFWLAQLFNQRIASDVIGVVEIGLGVMVAARPIAPRLCLFGSY